MTPKTTDMHVANTILHQLGGRAFIAMTGARDFIADGTTLAFRVPGHMTRERINGVRVKLDPSDTYSVEFIRIRGSVTTSISRHELVYADQLANLFAATTGLVVRAPRFVSVSA